MDLGTLVLFGVILVMALNQAAMRVERLAADDRVYFAVQFIDIGVAAGLILFGMPGMEAFPAVPVVLGLLFLMHVAQNYNRQRNTGLLYEAGALAAGIFVGGYAAAAGQMAGQLAAVAYINSFTREAEADADAFAVDALVRAGYDPEGLVSFFETLAAQGDGGTPEFLRSHPSTDNRIEHTRSLIAQ